MTITGSLVTSGFISASGNINGDVIATHINTNSGSIGGFEIASNSISSSAGTISSATGSFDEIKSTNNGSGIILTSPNGIKYRFTTNNDGHLQMTGSVVI